MRSGIRSPPDGRDPGVDPLGHGPVRPGRRSGVGRAAAVGARAVVAHQVEHQGVKTV